MEVKKVKESIIKGLQKYKFVALVLISGLVLMLLPSGHSKTTVQETQHVALEESKSIEEQLEEILSQISGAGNVKVMLTQSKGERFLYQTDIDMSTTDGSSSESADTVIITDANKNEAGLIVQIEPPVYLGAVIVCQGADKPAVKLALVDAVSKVTGLGANQITVLKMK